MKHESSQRSLIEVNVVPQDIHSQCCNQFTDGSYHSARSSVMIRYADCPTASEDAADNDPRPN